MERKILLLVFSFVVIMLPFTVSAQTTNWLWAKSAGSNSYEYARSVTTDFAGNSYIVGDFSATVVFDQTNTYSSLGGSDIYIIKYSPSGNILWVNRAGGVGSEFAQSVSTDQQGNVYVTGYYQSNPANFGSIDLPNAGGNSNDIFIVKYDPNGNVLWAKGIGGTGNDRGYAIKVDSAGYFWATGYFVSSSVAFDSHTLTNSGNTDIFLVKGDPTGDFLWAKSASGGGFDYSTSLTIDRYQCAYITGDFNSNALAFGSTILNQLGNHSFFAAKYDTNGQLRWAKGINGTSDCYGKAITVDSRSNCTVGGRFNSNISFAGQNYTSAGNLDAFWVKFDSAGSPVSSYVLGGTLEEGIYGLATDKHDNLYLTGYFKSQSLAASTGTLTNAGTSTADMFIMEFSPSGNLKWAKTAGGTADDIAYSIEVDTLRNFYITGYFSSPTLTFGTTTLMEMGTTDLFIAKSDNNSPTSISSEHILSRLNIFPNPASDKITVIASDNIQVEILSIEGKLMQSTYITENTSSIDISKLLPGIYFLCGTTEGISKTAKFIKQ